MFATEQAPDGVSARKLGASQTARRHNLLASAGTLLAQRNQQLHKVLAGYTEKFRPGDVQEQMFVREAAAADFRVQQIDSIESGLMASEMQAAYNKSLDADAPDQPENEAPQLADADPETQALMMGAAWAANKAAFALLIRYHGQACRDYYKALKHLELLRKGKAGYLPQDPAPPPVETAAGETNPTPPPPSGQTKPPAAPSDETKPNYVTDSHDSRVPAGPLSQKVARFFGKGAKNSDDRT